HGVTPLGRKLAENCRWLRWRSCSTAAERHCRGVPPSSRGADRSTQVDGSALREGPEPAPCRGQSPLLRAPRLEGRRVKVTVFGATGVVGRALLPLLISD